MLSVVINQSVFNENHWLVNYTLISSYSTTLYIVQDQYQPYLRVSPDGSMLEIWLGIPPQNEIEKNRLINALVIPKTFELLPGYSINKTVSINFPLKESGYWLEKSEETIIPVKNTTEINAQINQGFGINNTGHWNIRNIDELYAWQIMAHSQTFVLKTR